MGDANKTFSNFTAESMHFTFGKEKGLQGKSIVNLYFLLMCVVLSMGCVCGCGLRGVCV